MWGHSQWTIVIFLLIILIPYSLDLFLILWLQNFSKIILGNFWLLIIRLNYGDKLDSLNSILTILHFNWLFPVHSKTRLSPANYLFPFFLLGRGIFLRLWAILFARIMALLNQWCDKLFFFDRFLKRAFFLTQLQISYFIRWFLGWRLFKRFLWDISRGFCFGYWWVF